MQEILAESIRLRLYTTRLADHSAKDNFANTKPNTPSPCASDTMDIRTYQQDVSQQYSWWQYTC